MTTKKDDVLEAIIDTFCEQVKLNIELFRKFVPKEKAKTNSALTGSFMEALVKDFIQKWVTPDRYINGMLFPHNKCQGGKKGNNKCTNKKCSGGGNPLQVDGIVYHNSGPLTLTCGDFNIANPKLCTAVIEVKTEHKILEFKKRLCEVHATYFSHTTARHVIGIIIINNQFGEMTPGDQKMTTGNYCPIYPLFQAKKSNGQIDYIPYKDSIRDLIVNIYQNKNSLQNELNSSDYYNRFSK